MAEETLPTSIPPQEIPGIGRDRAQDWRPPTPETKPRHITVGDETLFYNDPPWYRNRIILGRADKPTSGEVLQELEHPKDAKKPKGKRRVALELGRGQKNSRGRYPDESRFWVLTGPHGFHGMPAKPKIEAQPNLGLVES